MLIIILVQVETAREGTVDTTVTSTLNVPRTKATQSGQYSCTFFYTVDGITYPVTSKTASLVIQGK